MSKRTLMLASVVREEVAPLLRMCPPACGIVSITRVEVSDDASYATVFISAFKEPDLALKHLSNEARGLQRKLSALDRRKIPILRFKIDRGVEHASRIDVLLGEVSKQLPADASSTDQEQRD